jgi:bifunctional non-homologous end joining protein LigD
MASASRLTQYRRMRNFSATPEPSGARRPRASQAEGRFVVHLHHARARHFDFRLELGGTLRSWAVPKGPSLDPATKRLAVQVEDHPLDYGSFEGEIPKGQYGAGHVWIWDQGTWETDGDAEKALSEGHLRFTLQGERLKGAWSLIRTRRGSEKKSQWLLIKARDAAEVRGDVADDTPLSKWRPPAKRRAGNGDGAATAKRARAANKRPVARFPGHIELQLARLVESAPTGDDWLHEVKYDGYRVLLWREGERVRITSRGDQDWTAKLPSMVRAVQALDCAACILDGELVAFDARGVSSFGALQQRFGESGGEPALRVMVFDLLYLDSEDMRWESQLRRKERLAGLLKSAQPPLQLSTHTVGHGPEAARAACQQGLEGIVSKAAAAPYEGGRGHAWLKVKCVDSDEFAIIGYTSGQGARERLGSLLLGAPARGGWRYYGRVGTGLNEDMIADLLKRLKKAARPVALENPPARAQLRGAAPVWVDPKLVVEVEFRGYTEDQLLRQASVKGLRRDRSVDSLKPGKRDAAVVSDRTQGADPAPAARARRKSEKTKPSDAPNSGSLGVRLTHPERVLFKDPKITKQELADFYRGIADFILPGLINRPVMLLRCPDGASGECFFQKHITHTFPASVHEVNDKADKQRWIYIDGLDGLLGLVQMSALEYHVWGSTVADLEHADRIVFDLDPAPGVPWKRVIEAARALRERLSELKLESFVRTSGGKGLHVVLPVAPAADWDSVRAFSRSLAEGLARETPERYLAVATKAERKGRIFIDYLRNARGSTAVCSYSLRNRPGVPIATPLGWEELAHLASPDQYRYANIGRRLKGMKADPWAGIASVRQHLPKLPER